MTPLRSPARSSAAAGVRVDVVDVGGGFPAAYPDMDPPPLGAFMAEIDAAYDRLDMPGCASGPSLGAP